MPAGANIWHVTAAGRAALMDGNNRGSREVQFTTMAIGTGSGPGGAADDAVVALRQQVGAAENVSGSTMVQGRVAVQATFNRAMEVEVAEVGVFARIGQGAEFLAAYWTDGGRIAATVVAAQPTVLAGVVDLQTAAADVAVTLEPALTLNPPAATFVELTDTPAALISGRILRVNGAGDAVGQETPASVLSALLGGLPAPRYLRTRIAGGVRSLEAFTPAQLADTLAGLGVALRVFTAAGNLAAPAAARRWLIVASGGGGGGGGSGALAVGAAGDATTVVGPGVSVEAQGGAGGRRGIEAQISAVQGVAPPPALAAGTVTGSRAGGVALSGAGVSGGQVPQFELSYNTGGSSRRHVAPTPGGAGGLVLALATPTPSAAYAVVVGAGGAGGNLGQAGAAGAVAVLEFIL